MNINRIAVLFLQAFFVFIGIGALVFLLWEPHLEGRNVNATVFEIYFKDPFLAYVYASSILLFVGLYQVYTVLGNIGRNELFTPSSLKTIRMIRHCAAGLIVCILGAEAYFFIVQRTKDDIAGGVAIGLFLILIFTLVSLVTGRFEKRLRKSSQV